MTTNVHAWLSDLIHILSILLNKFLPINSSKSCANMIITVLKTVTKGKHKLDIQAVRNNLVLGDYILYLVEFTLFTTTCSFQVSPNIFADSLGFH